jgi:hypothetical protein
VNRIHEKECNRTKYLTVQRNNSLRIDKTYRTISHKALCILTGLTPVNVKAKEVVNLYNITKRRNNHIYQIDKAENPRNWLHIAEAVRVNDTQDDRVGQLWHKFTDGSKCEQGVGSGFCVIHREGTHGNT